MGEFFNAYRRGRSEALAKYGPPPPFFRKKFAKPPQPASTHDDDEEETSRDFDTGAPPPGVQDDEAIQELIAHSEALQAENDRLVAEIAALKEAKDDADAELITGLKRELRESFASNTALKAELATSEERREIAEQACADLRDEIADLQTQERKRPGRGRP